jgi:hypothetical protein
MGIHHKRERACTIGRNTQEHDQAARGSWAASHAAARTSWRTGWRTGSVVPSASWGRIPWGWSSVGAAAVAYAELILAPEDAGVHGVQSQYKQNTQ